MALLLCHHCLLLFDSTKISELRYWQYAGQQTMVYLPWRQFVPVKRARVDPNAARLDPSKARQFGLVLSRFEFNGLPNPHYKAGRFSLKVCIWPPWSCSHTSDSVCCCCVFTFLYLTWADFVYLKDITAPERRVWATHTLS